MTDAELDAIEARAGAATPGPWSAFYLNDAAADWREAFNTNAPERATGGYVFRLDPLHTIRVMAAEPEIYEPGETVIVPDNGTSIANKRAICRGYDIDTGEPEHEELVDIRPHDAAFIASARTDIPALIAEIRRLKRGEFTADEFQSLCHHRDERPGCTAAEFKAGCEAYQARLFGLGAL